MPEKIELFTPIALNDMDEQIEIACEADYPAGFFGAPGIGKTSKALAYARRRKAANPKCGCFFIEGGSANVNDLIGYLMSAERTYMGADGEPITLQQGEYTFPFWGFDVEDRRPIFMCDEAYVIIDEFAQMDPAEQKAFATVLLEKRVGLHPLPAGTRFILLGNRFEDKSGVKKLLSFIINRMMMYEVYAEEKSLMAHAIANRWHPIVTAFIKKHGNIVLSNTVPEEMKPFCTPRTMDVANRIIVKALAKGWEFGDPRMLVALQAAIGSGPSKQLDTIARLIHTLPKMSSIVKDPHGTPVPGEPSAKWLLAFELANRATHDNLDALVAYVRRMESSFHVCFLAPLLSRDLDFYGNASVRDWHIDNHELMAACGALHVNPK